MPTPACTAFQGATIAASIQTYGILIPGKRPCGPKSRVIFKCPWAITRCHSNSVIPPFWYPCTRYPRIISSPMPHVLRIYGIPSSLMRQPLLCVGEAGTQDYAQSLIPLRCWTGGTCTMRWGGTTSTSPSFVLWGVRKHRIARFFFLINLELNLVSSPKLNLHCQWSALCAWRGFNIS